MSHEAHCVSVLYQRIFTGNAFVDGDQDFFLPQQLKHVPKPAALPLNNLANCYRSGELTGEVPLSIRGLKLSHQCNRNHATYVLPSISHSGPLCRAGEWHKLTPQAGCD